MPSEPGKTRPGGIPVAKTHHIARKAYDLSYVVAPSSPAQRLDVYWPAEGEGPFPVIVAVHGGAFMMGDKRDEQLEPLLPGLARGYAVVSINYRMSGEAIFPALVHDVRAAIRWVRAHAAQHGFDSERVAVWGGSAGGYLALMAGVAEGQPDLDDPGLGYAECPATVQAVVAWFPPTDFLKMDAQLEASGFIQTPATAHSGPHSPESRILGAPIPKIPELVRKADPATYLRPGLPPFFIQHGSADATVPYQQSLVFASKLAQVNGLENVTYELLLNARHGHTERAFNNPENVAKVLDFLDRALRR